MSKAKDQGSSFLLFNHLLKKQLLIVLGILLLTAQVRSQNLNYTRTVHKKLTSKSFHGRGYVKNGDGKAAAFIASQFSKNRLQAFNDDYFQQYSFPVNTFPGKIILSIDGVKLIPGEDFVISSSAPSVDGTFDLHFLPDTINNAESLLAFLKLTNLQNLFLVVEGDFRKLYGKTIPSIKGIILLTEKTPYWHVSNSGQVDSTIWLKIKKDRLPTDASTISLKAENVFIPNYPTQNVIAFIKGKKKPEHFVVFSAHYDHLGMMGNKTIYPGANDNGSGTAMLLDLARHYSQAENQPDYSIAFLAFSGEERGLMGSTFYAENPLFPLDQIELLVNLDMVGTGSEGITIVNSTVFPDLFNRFVTLNKKGNYLKEVKQRGESCNSDHCPFYQKSVQSIFIYTRGKEHLHYHTPLDNANDFPFTAYNGLFKLLTAVVEETEKQ
ncbi:MAG: arginyl aminopeptidase [Bacteroidetes bacterium]|nr:MAG: arginyl aminopeptidase [Bacteroidota bacterium]